MVILSENAQLIVDEIKKAIHRDLNIMDDDGTIIASTDHNRIGTLHEGARRLLQTGQEELIITADCEEGGTKRGINLPINIQGKNVGVIGITGPPNEVADLGSAIQKMTEIMVVGIQRQENLNQSEIALYNFIESWIFSENLNPDTFKMRARLLGIDLNRPRTICVFDRNPQQKLSAALLAQELNNAKLVRHLKIIISDNPQNICVSINSRIIVLFAEQDLELIYHQASLICHEMNSFFKLDLYCGISQPTDDYTAVGARYKEALNAHRTAICFGARKVVVYESNSPFYLVQCIPEEHLQFLEKSVFKNCNEGEKDELIETLNLFFKYDGNISQAAEASFVHTNTFLYRLNKFERKTGLSPRRPRDLATLTFIWVFCQLSRNRG